MLGSVQIGIVLLVLTGVTTAKDVFRYEDEETGQSHYMTGDPGQSVEGGWKFTNGDGTFELTYKADEEGFQPTADHLPVSPDDTNEVSEAKTAFYSLYEEAKARVAEAVAAAESESAETAEKVVEVSKREAHPPSWRRFWRRHHPFGYRHFYHYMHPKTENMEDMEAEEAKKFKFVPLKGFVPLEEDEETAAPLFKFIPYRGFIPEMKDDMEDKVYTYSPFYGYVPTTEKDAMNLPTFKFMKGAGFVRNVEMKEEMSEDKIYKYVPHLGFVPEDKEIKEPMFKGPGHYFYDNSHLKDMRYKFVPYYGFVPIKPEMETGDVEAVETVRRKKREDDMEVEADDNMMVESKQELTLMSPFGGYVHHEPKDITYEFHPYYGYVPKLKESSENEDQEKEEKLYKYVPFYGFVEHKEEEMESSEDEKEEVKLYKYDPFRGFIPSDTEVEPVKTVDDLEFKYVPYVGYVPVDETMSEEGEEESDGKIYKFHPYYGFVEKKNEDEEMEAEEKEDQLYKFVPYYGFIPVNDEGETEMKTETMEAEEKNHLTYSFHPYFGYMPTLVKAKDGEETEELLYKLDPMYGFVPAKKDDESTEETDAKRKKREAGKITREKIPQTLIYPSYGNYFGVPLTYIPTVPTVQIQNTVVQKTTTDEEVAEDTEQAQPLVPILQTPVVLPGLINPILGSPAVFTHPSTVFINPAQVAVKPAASPLPEKEFPVFPNVPENNEQGAFDF